MIIANGSLPSRFARSSLITTSAHAPSLTPGALPAVIVPSLSKAGFSFASTSKDVPALGASSVSTISGAPFR